MMKKGGLNFLNRRNQSLFDTNVQMKDMDNVEFEFDTVMIPDSGTAKVRSRPTVKHFSTFGDGAGFAVPTPTVPVLPSFTAPQISHTGKTDSLSNGSITSVDDFEEGQILIPPPPSSAPPPPPPQFIPPSPGHVAPPSAFFGEPHSPVDLSTLEPPSIPPPEPPSLGTPDVDLSMLRPPHMAPPKPPNYQISTDLPEDIPECPKFTPPLPPTEKSQSPTAKVQKMPPPKPIRFSYISNFELPASGSTTPSEKTASSFNSQNSGKLYTVPKTTILTDQSDQTHYMLLENNSKTSVGDHANGKASTSEKEMGAPQNLVPPVKPVRRNSSATKLEENLQDLKENMQQAATPVRLKNSMAAKVETPPDAPNKNPAPVVGSPTALRSAALLSAQDIIHLTPVDPARKYSPLLNRKLQNLKTSEPSGGKEGATSPLTLLMAAKEREKQRTVISRENSTKSNSSVESSNGSSHQNSFTVTPRPPVSPGSPGRFLESKHNTENLNVTNFTPEPSAHSIILTKNPTSIASPSGKYNGTDSISFIPPPPEFANSDPEDEAPPSMPPPDPPAKRVDVIPQLNSATITSGPTNPPSNKSSSTTTPVHGASSIQFKPKPQAPPPSLPKFQPQAPPPSQLKTQPQAPPPSLPKCQPQAPPPAPLKTQPQAPPPAPLKTQPQAPTPAPLKTQPQAPSPSQLKTQLPALLKTQPQAPPPAPLKTQPQAPPSAQLKTQPQAPPSVTASQATLLSILQKKMLEMDPKFAHAHEADASSDDWNSPTFDEDAVRVPSLNSTPKTKSTTVSSSLNMKELENKVIRKTQAKAPVSGSSKQQFGMTFIVRPGTKQPITPMPKTE
ncbi:protein piccolo isoform X2 [Tachysurus fulvidraco]|uniref:protein piccolo isoform X2 n=1 Tax=Tachysurus fulvidraco TaxID=1234273 RepID=UPI001FEED955|nr:protein piccolo isoform X2 [Tachysurus fulvidraco]